MAKSLDLRNQNFILSKSFCVHLFCYVLLLFLTNKAYGMTCSSSIKSSQAITSQTNSYTGYSSSYNDGIIPGPVSNSLYYMTAIYLSAYSTVIRKINSDESLDWMKTVLLNPLMKSLSVDDQENHIYFGAISASMGVCRLKANTGAYIDSQTFSFLNSNNPSNNIKIHVLSNDTGYYVICKDTSAIVNICKYLFSSSSVALCQKIPNFNQRAYGQLMLSDTQFFFLSDDTSTYSLHFYKFTFSNTSPDWANSIQCPVGTCGTSYSGSMLNADGSKIYSYFSYGNPKYLYFASFSVTNGGVLSSRYKSSINGISVLGSTLIGDYSIAVVLYSNYNIVIMNTAISEFTIKNFVGTVLYGCAIEPISGR